jgi:hypothetical protein
MHSWVRGTGSSAADKEKNIYDMFQAKVQGIEDKYLPLEKWTVAEHNTVLQWYKNTNDIVIPKKKAEKLARYYQICNRGDPLDAEIHLLPPLPSPQAVPVMSSLARRRVHHINNEVA